MSRVIIETTELREVTIPHILEIEEFWVIRVVRGTTTKIVVFEKELDYEPTNIDIGKMLLDYPNDMISVIKNYRIKNETSPNPYQE